MKSERRSGRLLLLVSALLAMVGVLTVLLTIVFRNSREYQRLIAAGDAALASGQSFSALEAYSGAVALRPDAMLPHLKRGGAYYTRGEFQNAVRDLRRAVQLDPAAPRALELLGDASAAYGRHASAAASYRRYLEVDDRSVSVLYKLGLALYRGGRPSEAVAAIEQALQQNADFAEAHHLLGLCLRDLGRKGEARVAFERAVHAAPALIAPREALVDLYASDGHQRLAAEQLEGLAALEPLRPERVAALGEAQAQTGRAQAALATLDAGLERFPYDALLHALQGRTWLQLAGAAREPGPLAKAKSALQRAASSPTASSHTLSVAAKGLLLAGDIETARKAVSEAVLRLPIDPAAHLYAAELAEADGRMQNARDAYVRYATLVGDSAPLGGISVRVADLSSVLGERGMAIRWFERSLAENEPTVAVLARFAGTLIEAGQAARARTIVAEGLAIDADDRALRTLEKRLAGLR